MLLLGSRHDEVTLLHYAEHIAPFGGKRIARYKVPILRDGARVWVDCEEFNTSGDGVHENWAENAFELIVDDFIAKRAGTPACRVGQVGLAASVFLDAADLVAHAMPIMESLGQEPRHCTDIIIFRNSGCSKPLPARPACRVNHVLN